MDWNTIANMVTASTLAGSVVLGLVRGGRWLGKLDSLGEKVDSLGNRFDTLDTKLDHNTVQIERVKGALGMNGSHQ